MPVFALANAGVTIGGGNVSLTGPVALGIMLGLFLGKLIGISLFSWLSVRVGVASLPSGSHWGHIVGAALLGGVGFTMALFVANLAFQDPSHLDTAKAAILAASGCAGVIGFLYLRFMRHSDRPS
jgi:NhaA family Na+:H+ antiporter